APPGIPAARLAYLDAAVKETLHNPQLIAEGERIERIIEYLDPEATRKNVVAIVSGVTPEQKAQALKLLGVGKEPATSRQRDRLTVFSRQERNRRNAMDMNIGVLDHYNVSTRKLGETIRFYEDVLGMKNGPRPPFNFPGAWIYSAG